jgi:hypothetical protein
MSVVHNNQRKGALVLKDTLNQLLTQEPDGCKFGGVMKSLDQDSQEILMKLMKNESISARAIHRALASEEIEIGRSTIESARHCVLSKSACKCSTVKELMK